MPADPKARRFSLPFTGGSLNATMGLLQKLVPAGLNTVFLNDETYTVNVDTHTRRKFPGGPATTVQSHTYTARRYPKGSGSGIATGENIRIYVDGEWWSARLTGSHYRFNNWLKNSDFLVQDGIIWKGERSKETYGPFGGSNSPN